MSRRDDYSKAALSDDARQQLAVVMDHAHRQIDLILRREISRLQSRAQELARQEATRNRDAAMRLLGDQRSGGAGQRQKPDAGYLEPVLLRDVQVAKVLGIHRNTVWNRVRQGKFPSPIKWDGLTVWRRQDIEAFVNAFTEGGQP